MTCSAHLPSRLRRGTPRRRLHQEQRCSSAGPPIPVFFVFRWTSMTAPSLPPGRSRSAPFSAHVLSHFHLVRPFNVFTDLLPAGGTTSCFSSTFPLCGCFELAVFFLKGSSDMPQTCQRKSLVSFPPEFGFSSVAMLGRKRARVFSKVATLSEKSRDAPPPSSLLPPSWRGGFRISCRIPTSHSQGPKVQIPLWSVSFFWSSSV